MLIYITGYPGSGKSTLAYALIDALARAGQRSAHLFSDKASPRPDDLLARAWWVLRNVELLACAALAIRRSKESWRPSTIARSCLKAWRLLLSQQALASAIRGQVADVVIADEPPLHRLWTAMFPAAQSAGSRLRKLVTRLCSPCALRCRIIHVGLMLSPEACVDRFKSRHLETSRFDTNTGGTLVSELLRDELYLQLQSALFDQITGQHVHLRVDEDYQGDLVAEIEARMSHHQ